MVVVLLVNASPALAVLSNKAEPTWQANGVIRDVVPSADQKTAYIGGDFDYVGPSTGYSVRVSAATGAKAGTWPVFTGGKVTDIEPMIGGGWVVVGSFQSVNGMPWPEIARVTPFGTLDTSWDPTPLGATGFDGGDVLDVEVAGAYIYVAGEFTTFNTISNGAQGLARLFASNGGFDSGYTNPGGFTGPVMSIAYDGTYLYAGGSFASYDGSTAYLVKLDANGDDTGWMPNILGVVNAVDIANGRLYVGGTFVSAGGAPHRRIAAYTLSTGAIDTGFTGDIATGSSVNEILATTSGVYVAGIFTTPSPHFARLNIADGNSLGWTPQTSAWTSQRIETLFMGGGYLYAGGSFTDIGGQSRLRVARYDMATHTLDANWNPSAGKDVLAISSGPGGSVVLGGTFVSVGGVTRKRVAQIDLDTGEATAWTPVPVPFPVYALAQVSDSIVAGGGAPGSLPQFAARSIATGASLVFTPPAFSGVTTGLPVTDMTAFGATVVVVGSNLSASARVGVIGLLPSGNLDTSFTPPALPDARDIEYVPGPPGQLYVAGGFSSKLVRLGMDGVADSAWGSPDLNGTAVDRVAADQNTVWFTGDFTTVTSQLRSSGRAALPANGSPVSAVNPLAWSPATVPSGPGTVKALALHDGDMLVGGTFTTLAGTVHDRLGATDPASPSIARTWTPNVPSPLGVAIDAIASSGTRVIVAGGAAGALAIFDRTLDALPPTVRVMAIDDVAGPLDATYVSSPSIVYVRTTGPTMPKFTTTTYAHDQYSVADPSYAGMAGLEDVQYSWTSTDNGTWTPTDLSAPGAARGLNTDCWKTLAPNTNPAMYLGRGTDRSIDYAFGSNDPDKVGSLPANLALGAGYAYPNGGAEDSTSFKTLSCRWTGWIVGPEENVDYRVRTNGDNNMLANIVGAPPITGWGATGPSLDQPVTFETSEPRRITVDWGEQDGDAEALLEWNDAPVPDANFDIVPEAAFVTNVEYVQEFELLDGGGATPGTKTIRVRANDRADKSRDANISVQVDNAAPNATGFEITGGFGWSSSGNYVVDLPVVTDPGGSGVDSLVLERQSYDTLAGGACGGTLTPWAPIGTGYLPSGAVDLPQTNMSTGCYQYRLTMTDRVGNPVTINPTDQNGAGDWHKVDRSGASGGATYTVPTQLATSVNVAWTGNDPHSGLDSNYTYLTRRTATYSGGDCISPVGPLAFGTVNPNPSINPVGLNDGQCVEFGVALQNGAGEPTFSAVGPEIRTDRTAPTGTLGLTNGALYSGTISIPVSVTDSASGVGAAKITYNGPGTNDGDICPGGSAPTTWEPPGGCPWNTAALAPGSYILTVVANDVAGNPLPTVTRTILIDNNAPTMSSVRFTELLNPQFQHVDATGTNLFFSPTRSGSVRVAVDATDSPGGVAQVAFGALGSTFTNPFAVDTSPAGDEYSSDYTFTAGGSSNPLGQVQATDAPPGSFSDSRTFSVTADPDAPINGAIDYPNGVAVTANLVVTPGSDPMSGIARTQVLRRSIALDVNLACPPTIVTQGWDATGMPFWTGGAPAAVTNVADMTVQRGFCYQYALELTDNVGNVAPLRTSLNTYISDAVGLVITAAPAVTPVSEAGGTTTWNVSLRTRPTADVTVTYVGDGQVGPSAPQTLSFTPTPGNWDAPRPITIGAIDDQVDEPSPHTGGVTFTMSSTGSPADTGYNNALPVTRQVQIGDNDKAGIRLVTSNGSLAIAEPASGATYGVRLESQPNGNVTVTLGHGAQATAAPGAPAAIPGATPGTLTFSPSNWATVQSVIVLPVNDPDIDGTQPTTVTHTSSSTHADDEEYSTAIMPVASLGMSVADDDVANFLLDGPVNAELSEADPNVVATVRARLTARPARDVTMTWGTAGGQIVPSAPVVFTPANWDQWQNSTIRANDDTIAEPPLHQVIGGASLSSADPNFAAVAPISGPAFIRDDDAAAFVTSPGQNWTTNDDGQLLLDESATTGSVLRIRTVGDPTSDITITPEATPADQLVISPASHKIAAGSHEQVVTFSVRALNDREKELDPHPAKVTWKVATGDVLYGAAAIPITVARIKDGEATTTRENTPDPTPTPNEPDPDPTPTPTPDPSTTGGDDNQETDDATPQPDGDASDDDDAPGETVGDDGSGAGDEAIAGTSTDDTKRTSRAATKSRNPAKRLKNWAGENKGTASVAASAAGTAALWGAKPLALAGKALMSGGGGVPGHPPGMGQVRHLFKRKFRSKLKRFWRGKKRDLDRDDDDDWDDFLWGDRAA